MGSFMHSQNIIEEDEMCGACETNMGKIGNNIYSDLNGKNWLEDQVINGRIKQVLKQD